ncbi:MAG: hypothetical protein ACREMB_06870 [Candidatus Rokuibacteriota bacterium]
MFPRLPGSLVDARARARIAALGARLPPFSAGLFECRLAAGRSDVDFHVFAARHRIPLPPACAENAVWRRLQGLSEEWAVPGSRLWRAVSSLVLEFDVGPGLDSGAEVPVPNPFFALTREAGRDPAVLLQLLRHQLPSTALRPLENRFARTIDALPDGAGVTHLGVMHSRATPLVRLVMGELEPPRLGPFLTAVGWPGDPAALEETMRSLASLVDSVSVAWDLSQESAARLGLECFFNDQPAAEPRWHAFVRSLVEWSLCDAVKGEALLSWPGVIRRGPNGLPWPRDLAMADRFMASHARSLFMCLINHVKLVIDGGEPCEAKAYLLFGHQWAPPEPARR